ncbi:MAG: acetyl-CoA carboxylase biotin carboxylase subunit [Gemmatimonadetes bacterium]|nr:acetyl-CoA carboxylase biotin carboxylase subunit [Gemmatimonadota bacterium]MBT7860453.1 acetyl-CoA carboxylase biotin carboxylase subunit [Gemmatimonadota bacterium]
MFKKILIADRGEIALRIIRTCKDLGIGTVAVYSEADAHASHVLFADEDVCIGPPAGEASYRNVNNIISAAELTNADAIHPGYGPLAENADFAGVCESSGIKFIGPPAAAIRSMGDKATARSSMEAAGVPVIPGSEKVIASVEEARKRADEIGYPVRLKATAGGGGRGMRVVDAPEELEEAWNLARLEARSAFTTDALYLERSIASARHIEVQILADEHGNVVHLGERECSIQRRHQKLLEESPSPVIDEDLRQRIGQAAVDGARSIGYASAGTMEFLVDEHLDFYFMEMNTRIQVEHPVSESVCGLDLIGQMIRVATGEPLGFDQAGVHLGGHAIECRINAEDPSRNFMPSAGKITALHVPGGPGVRVDSHIYQGYDVPPYYDSLLAKLITFGENRDQAIARMRRALDEFTIEGVATTIPFHRFMMNNVDFLQGQFDTEWVNRSKYGSAVVG